MSGGTCLETESIERLHGNSPVRASHESCAEVLKPQEQQQQGVSDAKRSGGSGGVTQMPQPPCNLNISNNSSRKHRRFRKHLPNFKRQKQRIRRNTQPAPYNSNEFLMQEHDHLFHLDYEGDEFPVEGGGVIEAQSSVGRLDVPLSSDEDDDFLSREFNVTYDNVNTERLASMNKSELIAEYQLLQERVETLERRLKSVMGARRVSPEEDAGRSLSSSLEQDNDQCQENEIQLLREENKQIRSANKHLRKLMYGPLGGSLALLNAQPDSGDDMETEADSGVASTDSGLIE